MGGGAPWVGIGFGGVGGEVKKNGRMGGALEMFVRNVKKQIQTSRKKYELQKLTICISNVLYY